MRVDQPTPTQIKAFIDDLARISLRHGISLMDGDVRLVPMQQGFQGYSADIDQTLPGLGFPLYVGMCGDIASIDIAELSAHERFRIMGGEAARARHEAAAERTLNDPECQRILGEIFGRRGGLG